MKMSLFWGKCRASHTVDLCAYRMTKTHYSQKEGFNSIFVVLFYHQPHPTPTSKYYKHTHLYASKLLTTAQEKEVTFQSLKIHARKTHLFRDGCKPPGWVLCSHIPEVELPFKRCGNQFVHADVFPVKLHTAHLKDKRNKVQSNASKI